MGESSFYIVTIIIQILGLGGLAYYAFKTREIAEESVRHNEILTTPVITIYVLNKGETAYGRTVRRDANFGDVALMIINHTPIHAEARFRVRVESKVNGQPRCDLPPVPAYKGEEIWNISAHHSILGHCPVIGTRELESFAVEDVYLIISIESRRHLTARPYNANPDIFYQWKREEHQWELRPATNSARFNGPKLK